MKNQTKTIRKIVHCLNNSDEEGGYWLPNIQRPFVWSEEQICRLAYQFLDDVEFSGMYKLDDVVEIFIRANSGGTHLGKLHAPASRGEWGG